MNDKIPCSKTQLEFLIRELRELMTDTPPLRLGTFIQGYREATAKIQEVIKSGDMLPCDSGPCANCTCGMRYEKHNG